MLHSLSHIVIKLFSGKPEPDKLQNTQIDNGILFADTQILLNSLRLYGHVELQHIHANLERIKNEMQKRGMSELKISGEWVIKLTADRVNIIKE